LVKTSVRCGLLYRGSQLVSLGVAGCAEFASLGIRSVIDLRTASEAATRSPQCTFDQAKYLAAPMPTPYNLSPTDYLADLHATDSMLAIFRVLGDVTAYPVYFHCIYGRDRTGVLAALILRLLGASREVVMAEYMRTADSGFGVAPASLQATLDEIDRLGGAETYLLSIGVPAQAIDVVRAQLTAPAAS
jgi:protein-tyrosine phosphatase